MSRPRLKISSSVIQRLSKLQEPSAGQLFGTLYSNTFLVLGYKITLKKKSKNDENDSEWENISDHDISSNLAAEVDMCGVFVAFEGDTSVEKDTWEILNVNVADNPVLLKINSSSKEVKASFHTHNKLEDADYDLVTEDEVSKSFFNVRVRARITLSCDLQLESTQDSISLLRKKVISGGVIFHIQNTDIYILGCDADSISGVPSESSVNVLFSQAEGVNEASLNLKKKIKRQSIDPIFVNMYMRSSNNNTSSQVAPVITYIKKEFKSAKINLPIDSLAMVPRSAKINQLYSILVKSISRNLKLIKAGLVSQFDKVNVDEISLPKTFHFLPDGFGHFISASYPSKYDDNQLQKYRETFHKLFSLPMDRPFFRKGNAVNTLQDGDPILINPHEGLNPSGVKDGEASLVQGLYAYHHYMQNRFDDKGWGCAYRSLQTICSWFRLQGYTDKPVPSHKEIQQCLVDIGDKPSTFVGSRMWIGSTEVSFCLDTILGISSRIVSVSSGDELSTKGGELSYHFKTQGTPVMIGGGVLAHTIIGVDYNKKTGALKFLILDPHYTEGEDLNVIQSKGWCGWKGVEFWKKDAFYNMCLPIRPKCL